jgi:drug/metabolite transporter (DMT)-like permease
MDAVVLALCSAALFGAMTVALRPALAGGGDPFAGAFTTVVPALCVALVAATVARAWHDVPAVWPFAVAGLIAPGLSQTLFTLAVRDAGPSRTSAMAGTAPLFAVTFAVVLLDEPLVAGIVSGALLIVGGGIALASERDRPGHVKTTGLLLALAAALAFALRDTLARHLAVGTDVAPELAISATLAAGALAMLATLLVARRGLPGARAWAPFVPPGVLFGLSYVALYEAFYRGRLSVVSPLVATESLFGVGLSALFLRHVEGVGRRLVLGACLVVAGGILIGFSR